LATVYPDKPYRIIYFPVVSLFLAVTTEMGSEKLLLIPRVTKEVLERNKSYII
jgi:hypothetical protein